MAYNEWGEWEEAEDPYRFADYFDKGGQQHVYNPTTGQQQTVAFNPDGTKWAPTPSGHEIPDAPGKPGAYFVDEWPPPIVVTEGPTPIPPPRPPPPPPPGPNNPGGDGGGPYVPGTRDYPIAGGAKFFDYPDWTPPNIDFGTFTPPSWDVQPFSHPEFTERFAHPDFVGPTAETFKTDPGYDFREKRMLQALTNDRSARGLRSTGGTLADLMSMAGGLASQEYGNVWGRDFQGWQANKDKALQDFSARKSVYDTNRANAADIYGKGYQAETDEYSRALTGYLTDTDAKEREWARSRDTYSTNLGKTMGQFGVNTDLSRLNLARDNSQFGNLLSLQQIMSAGLPRYQPTV